MEPRNSFPFYRSFYEALKDLPPEIQAPVFVSICAFSLDGQEPDLSGIPAAMYTLVRPVLEASRKKAASGQIGGTVKANSKQTVSKQQAKPKLDRGIGIDRDRKDITPLPPDEPKVQWADNVTMTNAEHEKLLSTHGPADTARLIEILDNYKGSTGRKYKEDYRAILSWCIDRLREERGKPKTKTGGNVFLNMLEGEHEPD